jgi:hypothetical protein
VIAYSGSGQQHVALDMCYLLPVHYLSLLQAEDVVNMHNPPMLLILPYSQYKRGTSDSQVFYRLCQVYGPTQTTYPCSQCSPVLYIGKRNNHSQVLRPAELVLQVECDPQEALDVRIIRIRREKRDLKNEHVMQHKGLGLGLGLFLFQLIFVCL